MSASTDEHRIHTYLDDIKFQAVKGKNKRTAFVSSDHQIVSQNAQVIKSIEKTEKLVSADFRRQQTALLKNLDRLQMSREKSVYFSGTRADGGNIFSRRHSSPCLEKTFVSRQNSNVSTSPTHHGPIPTGKKHFSFTRERKLSNSSNSNSNRERKNIHTSNPERQLSNSSEGGDSNCSRDSVSDDVINHPTLSRQSSTGSYKLTLVDARRLSHDIQEETSKMAMEKIDQIVTGHRRRATIAEGATPNNILLPSSELLSRLSKADSNSDCDT